MEIARPGARTTPLDPRFAPRVGAPLPGRAPATRVMTRRSGGGQPVAIEAGGSMGALNEAIVAFESVGAGPVGEDGMPVNPLDPSLYRPTILPDGTVLPAGMTMGHRTMRVRFLKRMLKSKIAERGKLLLSHGTMVRWLVGLSMALMGARDNLRIAIQQRAEPGRIQKLTAKITELEGQVAKMERDIHSVLTQVGVLTISIDDMTAELLTFGEMI